MIKRIIPLDEVVVHYPDLAELAVIFNHEVIEDEHGTARWKTNTLIKHAVPNSTLNELFIKVLSGHFPLEEWIKFNMDTGYSLSGFLDLFELRSVSDFGIDEEDEAEEHVVDYMLRVHKGQVIKI